MPRILFVLRHRDAPWGEPYSYTMSSGLRNSVRFLVEMLEMIDISAKWVEVIDNNAIDAAVKAYRPTHVIVEAFWVVPEKFPVLMKLHPHVQWCVRNHSELSFLSQEGVAMEWVAGYLAAGVEVMTNAPRSVIDLGEIAAAYGYKTPVISYAPNYYPLVPANKMIPHPAHADDTVRVGCFGAIRQLKNQLAQAVAALTFVSGLGKKLEFHVNSSRIEPATSNSTLKNLRALFASAQRATLVEHGWLEHSAFLMLLHTMDFSMQVSYSETFNIVAADSVACSVPVIASTEVAWIGAYAQASANSTPSMVTALLAANAAPASARLVRQWNDLTAYNVASRQLWSDRFGV